MLKKIFPNQTGIWVAMCFGIALFACESKGVGQNTGKKRDAVSLTKTSTTRSANKGSSKPGYQRVKRKRYVKKLVMKINPQIMAEVKKKWPNVLPITSGRMVGQSRSPSLANGKKEMVLTSHFLMDRTEVSVALYHRCVRKGHCSVPIGRGRYCNYAQRDKGNHPVNCVTWKQANRYCQSLGKRLPDEQEWKFAAQGPQDATYPWGNQSVSCQRVVYRGEGTQAGCDRDGTWPVASLPGGNSLFGLADMLGNVEEWVADCAKINEQGKCTHRKIMGGSWQSMGGFLSTQIAANLPENSQGPLTGFRCAVGAPPNLFVSSHELQEVEEWLEVPIVPEPSRRDHHSMQTTVREPNRVSDQPTVLEAEIKTYLLSIPEVLIAPCDSQCKNWDGVGGIPQLKLLEYRREFRKLTKSAVNQYCWHSTPGKWTCDPQEKSFLGKILGLANKLMDSYQSIHKFAQTRGYFQPDPELVVSVRKQRLIFKKRNDTFAPSWIQGQRILLAKGDTVSVSLYDKDPFLKKAPIATFRFVWDPPSNAHSSPKIRYIHNQEELAKFITLQWEQISP